MSNEKHKTIFLDRDGTLNVDVDYLARVGDLIVFPFTSAALEILKSAGYMLVVVTNQSGIGRGLYDEQTLRAIHDELQQQVGGVIDAFYFCPHLPDGGCECRKPGLQMVREADNDLGVHFENSWMIGDKKLDVDLGFAANVKTALVRTGYGRSHERSMERPPDLIADNILEAAKQIVEIDSQLRG